jgi:hypothetical protein
MKFLNSFLSIFDSPQKQIQKKAILKKENKIVFREERAIETDVKSDRIFSTGEIKTFCVNGIVSGMYTGQSYNYYHSGITGLY